MGSIQRGCCTKLHASRPRWRPAPRLATQVLSSYNSLSVGNKEVGLEPTTGFEPVTC